MNRGFVRHPLDSSTRWDGKRTSRGLRASHGTILLRRYARRYWCPCSCVGRRAEVGRVLGDRGRNTGQAMALEKFLDLLVEAEGTTGTSVLHTFLILPDLSAVQV